MGRAEPEEAAVRGIGAEVGEAVVRVLSVDVVSHISSITVLPTPVTSKLYT